MTRPRIGLTLAYDTDNPARFTVREDYVRSVEKAGGLPLVLAPTSPADVPDLLGHCQALIMTGGSDVDPALYGQEPHPKLGRVFRERDEFEIALCREALERDLPILAICRGHQVLNVATGGTLIQDIPSVVSGAADHDPRTERWETAHEVRILPGTRLREILGKDRVAVNSFHHQAVGDLGRGLVASAVSESDRIVEGIEVPDRRFAVGVQWHPEGFWREEEGFHSLFAALVAEGSVR
ncbi:MAG: gamma-glutamyl-gamma-aminobutyrate hydrolase family protein [Acidobacteria bacterium]|nr:gamma-glutamyl-gamma-aminobutyrate hydrolase family protein [Acidobacteriota bacterium]